MTEDQLLKAFVSNPWPFVIVIALFLGALGALWRA
jgi:hypothetical protein